MSCRRRFPPVGTDSSEGSVVREDGFVPAGAPIVTTETIHTPIAQQSGDRLYSDVQRPYNTVR